MAKTVTIQEWCDPHYHQDPVQFVEAVWKEGPVRIGDWEADEVMLCADCAEAYVSQLQALVQQIGTVVKGTKTASAKFSSRNRESPALIKSPTDGSRVQCPLCDNDYKNRGSLNGHMADAHDVTLSNWEAQQRGEELPSFPCPECGEVKHSLGGLGKHRSDRHGVPGQAPSTLRRRGSDGSDGDQEPAREPALV